MNLSAVLLAGGESRRMGREKATLIFNEMPLWKHQLQLLQAFGPAELFLSARSDPQWRPGDVEFVCDEPPSRGPLSGLAASLGRIRSTHLLVLAIDMPLMSEPYLRAMCERLCAGCGTVPFIRDRAEPLAAVYPVEVLPEIMRTLRGQDFSLQKLIHRLIDFGRMRAAGVTREEEVFFRNWNEVADVEA